MKHLLLIYSLLFVSGNCLFSQELSFYKEDLKFYLDTNCFTVDGLYYFSNSDSAKINQLIFYPFPTGILGGTVDSIFVYDSTMKKNLNFFRTKDDSAISFPLNMEGYGFRKIQIFYRQHHNGYCAKYILKTTQNWGRSLETADFSLTVPKNIGIDSLSYPADRMIQSATDKTYFWSKKDFMPGEDFLIYFQP